MLAFENMSDDAGQEYFSDVIAADIIAALSRSPWLFIIARNTTFTCKGERRCQTKSNPSQFVAR